MMDKAGAVRQRRSFGWRAIIVLFLSLCAFLGAVVMVFGVFSMRARAMPGDDILAAETMVGAFALIGGLLLALALKLRRRVFYDAGGRRVNEDGSSLAFIAMAPSPGDDSADFDDDYDGDFDGDFD